MKKRVTLLALILTTNLAFAQRTFSNDPNEADVVVRELPKEWKNLVRGGRFMDRFLPMPKGTLSSDVWGIDGVKPRYIDNGIENDSISYWGGNVLKGEDGRYHLFVCGWREDNPRGHRFWGQSTLYNTVSDNPIGPFAVVDSIGYGHNVDCYRIKDRRYVCYSFSMYTKARTFGFYIAPTINGPWSYEDIDFIARDRKINVTTNLTFSQREDGSFLAVGKDGKIWVSRNGLNPYYLLTDYSTYPNVQGYLEDPAIWHDNVQFHMVVNDAKGRVAYYGRSLNGVDWLWEDGVAYVPGKLSVHENGHVEDWHKYERIKIFQDEYGRAIQANFAVLDTQKELDKGNDNHSAKNISIPMNPGLLIEWVGNESEYPTKNFTPTIKIKAEKGFNPQTDINISSLRFGDSKTVNFGGGSKVVSTKNSGDDLIITFDSDNHKISSLDFAPKLLGSTKNNKLIFGYTCLPWISYNNAILSALAPQKTDNGVLVKIENWGTVESKDATVIIKDGETEIGKTTIKPIKPYQNYTAKIDCKTISDKVTIEIYTDNKQVHKFVTDIKN